MGHSRRDRAAGTTPRETRRDGSPRDPVRRQHRPRVVVLAGHRALGEALCHVLEGAGYRARHIETRASAGLASVIVKSSPDVVVVGAELGLQTNRMTLIADLAEVGIPVVGLTGHADDAVRRRLMRRSGASAVVEQTDRLSHFIEVVDALSDGTFVPSVVPEAGPEERERERYVALLELLTPREREVLDHLRLGHTTDEIAKADHVARSTVRAQVARVLRKLEVSTQLAAVAVSHWALSPDRLDPVEPPLRRHSRASR